VGTALLCCTTVVSIIVEWIILVDVLNLNSMILYTKNDSEQ
jgi:hypothetical protein